MATTKEYKEFILESLSVLDNITIRPMMGEYLLYYQGFLFGGIYDNRLLIKPTAIVKEEFKKLEENIPYKGAKPMLFLQNLDDEEQVKNVIIKTVEELKKININKK